MSLKDLQSHLLAVNLEVAPKLHLGDPVWAARTAFEALSLITTEQQRATTEGDKKHFEDLARQTIKTELEAYITLNVFLQRLLDENLYGPAAKLLWKPTQFSPEPRCVKMIFEALSGHRQVMLQGAASMGKSFNVGVWHYLDWRRDPEYTNVQVVGPSENHLETNLFSHLVNLHRNAAIPGPGVVTHLCLAIDPHDKYAGIKGVVIPLGKKSAGRLQGVKIKQRPVPHPIFGPTTRLRVVLEESENIPPGVWEDIINVSANAGESLDRFKVSGAYNPKDITSQTAIRAEPVGGWESIDIENDEVWESRRGWHVVRLDATKSENVLQGEEIYPGLQTATGLEAVILNSGGVGTPGYYSMARGWYPVQGLDTVVLTASLLSNSRGEYLWMDEGDAAGGFDVALEGDDSAFLAVGRVGRAYGYRKLPGDTSRDGEVVLFTDEFGRRTPKFGLQVDQLIALPKADTVAMSSAVKAMSVSAMIQSGWLGVDRTGNGAGVHDLLKTTFGGDVQGFNGSQSPSEQRILVEDTRLPKEEYSDMSTEMWFAVRKWLEVDGLKFGPMVSTVPLWAELTGRRFQQRGGGRVKLESKAAFKSRGNKSPDRADAVAILLQTVRQRSRLTLSHRPSEVDTGSPANGRKPRVGITDRFKYLD